MINKDILINERQTQSPLIIPRNGSFVEEAKQNDKTNPFDIQHRRKSTLADMLQKFKSEVQIGKPGSATGKVTPNKGSDFRSGLKPISNHQMIIEKLKLDELLSESHTSTTYKTVANFTFTDGSVQEGVLELDSHQLKVKENYVAPRFVIKNKAPKTVLNSK